MLKKFAGVLVLMIVFCLPGMSGAQSLDGLSLITESYPPYNYEQDGEIKGMSVDILEAVLDETGSSLSKSDVRLLPWATGYDKALNEENTVLFACTRTDQREDKFKWAGPISPTKISLVAKKGSGVKIGSMNDIAEKDYTIGVVRDDVGQQLLESGGVPSDNIEVESEALLNIRKLDRGRVDAWAYEENVAMWLINSNGFNSGDFEAVHELQEGELYFAFNKQTPDSVVDAFQEALDKIVASGKYEKILNNYK